MVIKKMRKFYNDLRDDFAANRTVKRYTCLVIKNKTSIIFEIFFLTGGFNIVLIIVIILYLAAPLRRFFLEYKINMNEYELRKKFSYNNCCRNLSFKAEKKVLSLYHMSVRVYFLLLNDKERREQKKSMRKIYLRTCLSSFCMTCMSQ